MDNLKRVSGGGKLNVLLLACIAMLQLGWKSTSLHLKNGTYQATISRADGNNIVFGMQVKDSANKKILYVLNAAEKLLVDSIVTRGDSVFIQMPFFESAFRAVVDGSGNLQGQWVKKFGDRIQLLPFAATFNNKKRFTAAAPPRYNIAGRWSVIFTAKNQEVTDAVGEFTQTGTRLTGTFLTTTGDYRYLEGTVSGDSLVLSGFDGGHAFLFTAKMGSSNTIVDGHFYSGATGMETWTAKKDAAAKLPDGYEQTKLRDGEQKLHFRFTGTDGKEVSIDDKRYKNKVVLVQIMGSWCPNCMDETAFLSDYYRHNKQRGVEIIGLAYERTTNFETSKASLLKFEKRLQVEYPILITGVTLDDPQRTEKTLPQLTRLEAFPTSIFIDRRGDVKKIYTGFTGPGTGEHYAEFKKQFEETVSSLLKENID